MYTKGSEECLNNAERLLADAKALMEKGSFGAAQSLSVTCLEEVGKAIILELANLNIVGKDVVDLAMRTHFPKKVILVGIEKSTLILGENLVREAGDYIINKTRLENFKKQMNADLQDLEKRRTNGFYVQVNPEDGSISHSPNRVDQLDARSLIGKADVFLKLGRALCEVFRNLKKRTLTNARIQKVILPTSEYDPLTISWDEI